MAKRIFLMCLLTAGFVLRLSAQQDPQFTQYMFNTIYYNPGFSGVEGVTKITALHRSQWLGYAPTTGGGGAPTTQMITFSTPIFKLKSGFGGLITHDNLGPYNNMEAQASYAYHLGLKNSKLSFGLRAGIYSQTIDANYFKAIDYESFLNGGAQSQIRPDMAVGVYWRKEKFYLGASFDHLTHATFDFGKSIRNPLQSHLYVTGGYIYAPTFDLKFHFTGLVQSDLVKTSFNISSIEYLSEPTNG